MVTFGLYEGKWCGGTGSENISSICKNLFVEEQMNHRRYPKEKQIVSCLLVVWLSLTGIVLVNKKD
jgi:hypothetical protein